MRHSVMDHSWVLPKLPIGTELVRVGKILKGHLSSVTLQHTKINQLLFYVKRLLKSIYGKWHCYSQNRHHGNKVTVVIMLSSPITG